MVDWVGRAAFIGMELEQQSMLEGPGLWLYLLRRMTTLFRHELSGTHTHTQRERNIHEAQLSSAIAEGRQRRECLTSRA